MQIIRITGETTKLHAMKIIDGLPRDGSIEVCIRKHQNKRNNDQNALYWAGPLKDIADQAIIDGIKYSERVWNVQLKTDFLPDENLVSDEYLEKRVVKPEMYRKWDILPNGDRSLCASTPDLTEFGMAEYLEQVYAFGAELGVMFTANPREAAAYE